MKVSYGQIGMGDDRRNALLAMKTPHDKKSLERFLG